MWATESLVHERISQLGGFETHDGLATCLNHALLRQKGISSDEWGSQSSDGDDESPRASLQANPKDKDLSAVLGQWWSAISPKGAPLQQGQYEPYTTKLVQVTLHSMGLAPQPASVSLLPIGSLSHAWKRDAPNGVMSYQDFERALSVFAAVVSRDGTSSSAAACLGRLQQGPHWQELLMAARSTGGWPAAPGTPRTTTTSIKVTVTSTFRSGADGDDEEDDIDIDALLAEPDDDDDDDGAPDVSSVSDNQSANTRAAVVGGPTSGRGGPPGSAPGRLNSMAGSGPEMIDDGDDDFLNSDSSSDGDDDASSTGAGASLRPGGFGGGAGALGRSSSSRSFHLPALARLTRGAVPNNGRPAAKGAAQSRPTTARTLNRSSSDTTFYADDFEADDPTVHGGTVNAARRRTSIPDFDHQLSLVLAEKSHTPARHKEMVKNMMASEEGKGGLADMPTDYRSWESFKVSAPGGGNGYGAIPSVGALSSGMRPRRRAHGGHTSISVRITATTATTGRAQPDDDQPEDGGDVYDAIMNGHAHRHPHDPSLMHVPTHGPNPHQQANAPAPPDTPGSHVFIGQPKPRHSSHPGTAAPSGQPVAQPAQVPEPTGPFFAAGPAQPPQHDLVVLPALKGAGRPRTVEPARPKPTAGPIVPSRLPGVGHQLQQQPKQLVAHMVEEANAMMRRPSNVMRDNYF